MLLQFVFLFSLTSFAKYYKFYQAPSGQIAKKQSEGVRFLLIRHNIFKILGNISLLFALSLSTT